MSSHLLGTPYRAHECIHGLGCDPWSPVCDFYFRKTPCDSCVLYTGVYLALGRGVSGFLLWQVLGGAPIAISISQDCPSFACLISRSSDNEDRPERKARNRTELLEAA